ncbi:hypothetical protein DFH06DRAFT_1162831 [Mycena polygramma]|nr:hypothetical protein DFH06DRAFT_1162831 [Mycena polygramma]
MLCPWLSEYHHVCSPARSSASWCPCPSAARRVDRRDPRTDWNCGENRKSAARPDWPGSRRTSRFEIHKQCPGNGATPSSPTPECCPAAAPKSPTHHPGNSGIRSPTCKGAQSPATASSSPPAARTIPAPAPDAYGVCSVSARSPSAAYAGPSPDPATRAGI